MLHTRSKEFYECFGSYLWRLLRYKSKYKYYQEDINHIQLSMKNHYDFDQQIKSLNDIGQTCIDLAEMANQHLKQMPQEYLKKAVRELKVEYEQQYLKDHDKIALIYSTLNLVQREKITNVDELFMDLATEINDYYREKKINLEKKEAYTNKCRKCQRYVSNYYIGLKCHQVKCLNQGSNRKKRKKIADTQEQYQQRQSFFKEAQHSLKPELLNKPKKEKLSLKKAKKTFSFRDVEADLDEEEQLLNNKNNLFYFQDSDQEFHLKTMKDVQINNTISSLQEMHPHLEHRNDFLQE